MDKRKQRQNQKIELARKIYNIKAGDPRNITWEQAARRAGYFNMKAPPKYLGKFMRLHIGYTDLPWPMPIPSREAVIRNDEICEARHVPDMAAQVLDEMISKATQLEGKVEAMTAELNQLIADEAVARQSIATVREAIEMQKKAQLLIASVR